MKRIVMANSIEKSCMLIISYLQIHNWCLLRVAAGRSQPLKLENCFSLKCIIVHLHNTFTSCTNTSLMKVDHESLCWSIEFSPELWDLWDALMWTACEALATKPLLPEPTVNQTSSDSSPEVPPSWLQLLYDYWHRNVTILLKIWVDFSGTFLLPQDLNPQVNWSTLAVANLYSLYQ